MIRHGVEVEYSERRDERIATQVALSVTCITAIHRERRSNLVHRINCLYRRTAIDTLLYGLSQSSVRRTGTYTNRKMCVTKYVRC